MSFISRYRWRISIALIFTLSALIFSLVFGLSSMALTHAAGEQLTQISSDPYHNLTSQHKTEVEPDTFAFGNTIVATFQVGRFFNGGASNIGWSTSTDAGKTWAHGFLPHITVFAGGPYNRASDASVAYDAQHKVWIISYLAIVTGGTPAAPIHVDVLASRSTNGGLTWGTPVIVRLGGPNSFLDKNWTVCDDTATSPFYGHCYTEYDNNNLLQMTTSTDGGKTWGLPKTTPNHALVIGGQPLVRPNGTVVVPIEVFNATFTVAQMAAFTSTNGGASWNNPVVISGIHFHTVAGNLRTSPLPSAEVDGSGKVYVVWEDCRFEAGCSANDIVLSTSTNGTAWSAVKRIPINPRGSGVDHFIPGIAVERTTSDGSAHIGLTYYYYPNANCTVTTCRLDVGFISSINGGASWSKAEQLAGPMNLTWLPLTSQGYMVGDYISTSIIPGDDDANGVFEVAHLPTGAAQCSDAGAVCHQDTFTTPEDLLQVVGGTNTSASDPTAVAPSQPSQPGFASTNY